MRGRSLISTIIALGKGAICHVSCAKSASRYAVKIYDNIFTVAEQIDELDFFSEVYIIFPVSNDYYLNNQISAITADGSLEFIFSIFETTNLNEASRFEPNEPRIDIFPALACNSETASSLTSGTQATIVTSQASASNKPLEQEIVFRTRIGDTVETILSFCNFSDQVLWWRVRNNRGDIGWIPESVGSRIYMEPVDD